jgi:hypothetical protein
MLIGPVQEPSKDERQHEIHHNGAMIRDHHSNKPPHAGTRFLNRVGLALIYDTHNISQHQQPNSPPNFRHAESRRTKSGGEARPSERKKQRGQGQQVGLVTLTRLPRFVAKAFWSGFRLRFIFSVFSAPKSVAISSASVHGDRGYRWDAENTDLAAVVCDRFERDECSFFFSFSGDCCIVRRIFCWIFP